MTRSRTVWMTRLSLTMAACLLGSPTVAVCAEPMKTLTGGISGLVRDMAGVPQMGAAVTVYSRFDRLLHKVLTDEHGRFDVASLPPDFYSIRVQVPRFLPIVRSNIHVQPGLQSVLAINLAGMLSSIDLVYRAPKGSVMMSDDWQWVLRSSMATRPILRALPGYNPVAPTTTLFSDTRGVLRVSAGDPGSFPSAGAQPDLGTAFALATSLAGSSQLEVTGNVGFASQTGLPTASLRTSFRRSEAGQAGPQVNVTVRQLMLPGRVAASLAGQEQATPALRTLSLGTVDRLQLADSLRLEYGGALDSVLFTERLHYLSPFARVTWQLAPHQTVQAAYSSGAPPVDLLGPQDEQQELQRNLSALGFFPRVSLRNGRAHVQRSSNWEVGYRAVAGRRTYSLGVHLESVSNAAVTLAGDVDADPRGDLLPDLTTRNYVMNLGRYRSLGYMAAVTESLGDQFTVTLAVGSGGRLKANDRTWDADDPSTVRAGVTLGRQYWAMAKVAGTIPMAGTHVAGSYQWVDSRSLTPNHVYLTQRVQPEAGLNVYIRQPLPSGGLMPGRWEAMCELRNLLAEGYLPMTSATGRQIVLLHTPSAMRGGLSFTF